MEHLNYWIPNGAIPFFCFYRRPGLGMGVIGVDIVDLADGVSGVRFSIGGRG